MSKELAALAAWFLTGYFGTGMRKAVDDLSQPPHNLPGYMRRSRFLGTLFAVFCWPFIWYIIWSTSRRFGMERTPNMKRQLPVMSSFLIAAVVSVVLYLVW